MHKEVVSSYKDKDLKNDSNLKNVNKHSQMSDFHSRQAILKDKK